MWYGFLECNTTRSSNAVIVKEWRGKMLRVVYCIGAAVLHPSSWPPSEGKCVYGDDDFSTREAETGDSLTWLVILLASLFTVWVIAYVYSWVIPRKIMEREGERWGTWMSKKRREKERDAFHFYIGRMDQGKSRERRNLACSFLSSLSFNALIPSPSCSSCFSTSTWSSLFFPYSLLSLR